MTRSYGKTGTAYPSNSMTENTMRSRAIAATETYLKTGACGRFVIHTPKCNPISNLKMSDFSAQIAVFPREVDNGSKQPNASGEIEVLATEIPNLIAFLQQAERENDYKGNSVVKLRVALWQGVSQRGGTYLSGKVTPPRPAQTGPVSLDSMFG